MLMLVAGRAQEGCVRRRLSRTMPVAKTRSPSANMTMGIDMSPLFSEVVACMNIQVLEIKKMVHRSLVPCHTHIADRSLQVYLYLGEFCSIKPGHTLIDTPSQLRQIKARHDEVRHEWLPVGARCFSSTPRPS